MALDQVEKLKRPAGILRYENDSYQSANYWIATPNQQFGHGESLGDTAITESAYLERFKGLVPDSEAQWFFDSGIAWARLNFAKYAKGNQQKIDLHLAKLHLKRAWGMITGNRAGRQLITADGAPIEEFQLPESINTVLIEGRRYYLPSTITPLNWSKSWMAIAMREMDAALASQ
jgi:hypothetical protein